MAGTEVSDSPSGRLPEGLEVEPVPFVDPLERRLGLPMPLWGPRALWRLWRAVGRADLVHVHDYLYQPTLLAIADRYQQARDWHVKRPPGF